MRKIKKRGEGGGISPVDLFRQESVDEKVRLVRMNAEKHANLLLPSRVTFHALMHDVPWFYLSIRLLRMQRFGT